VRALKRAKKLGFTTNGMTGQSGGKLKTVPDVLLNAPARKAPRIQEAHILIGHIICELVERAVTEQEK
jgi:D-sedoheptulose 7-phosphate isomerase